MFQKPKLKRQRKAKNNPVPTEDDLCFYCKIPFAQTHEIFQGRNRQNSIKYGMQLKLCNACHEFIHRHQRTWGLMLKRIFQKQFEEKYGHERFMEVFGKNYLDESEVA